MSMPESHERPDEERARDERAGQAAAAARIRHQAKWVDLQIQQAMERGEFDDLPGYGKPIEGLGGDHDPDWWLRNLVEREHISVLPPALQIRKDDAELDGVLDGLTTETLVRREVEEFNQRIRQARIQPLGGPPMITPMRDVEAEVAAWARRRAERVATQREHRQRAQSAQEPRRRWWRRS